jgi:hypothetical protein
MRQRHRERALFSRQHVPRNKPDDDEKEDMEQKTARLTVLIDPTKKDAFEQLCASQDVTPSQVVRQLIREYLEKHGATYANQQQNTNGSTNDRD